MPSNTLLAKGSSDGPEVDVSEGGRDKERWIWADGNRRAMGVVSFQTARDGPRSRERESGMSVVC